MLGRSGFPDQQGFHGGGLFRGHAAGAVGGGGGAEDGGAGNEGVGLCKALGGLFARVRSARVCVTSGSTASMGKGVSKVMAG